MVVFALTLVCIDTSNPLLRLGFFIIIPVFYFFKNKIDESLNLLSSSKKAWKLVKVVVVILLVARVAHCSYRLLKPNPNMEDIAHVHLRAFDALFLDHKNPYSEPLDHYPVGSKDYAGFKYPPLGLFFYAPFIALLAAKGIYLANALLYFLAAFLIGRELLKYSRFHSALGLIFFFCSDFYFRLAMNRGTNDFLPSLLMLLGVMSLRNSKEGAAGIYWGLSLLVKPFPVGLILFLSFFQKKFKAIAISVVFAMIGFLPFLFWDKVAFTENVIIFNLLRPVRESSILVHFSPLWQTLTPFLGLLILAGLSFMSYRFSIFNLKRSWFFITIGTLLFLLTSKMTPYHYFVWLLPFLIFYYLVPLDKKTSL